MELVETLTKYQLFSAPRRAHRRSQATFAAPRRTVKISAILKPATVFATLASPAWTQCASHAEIEHALATKFGEIPVLIGQVGDGRIAEVFAAAPNGSWTLVIGRPGQPSCIVASGQDYSTFRPGAALFPGAGG